MAQLIRSHVEKGQLLMKTAPLLTSDRCDK